VSFKLEKTGSGWESPALAPWLDAAIGEASQAAFSKPHCFLGEGGSIPFMGMLGKRFPEAQFVITGVLGPASNAHGPNEFLDINMSKNVTICVAHIVHALTQRAK
jgi:acetylornithine deacetylase/succinyl-diaminopimelate desuccinylase-like protein